ncbi:MAG: hypothetical protein JNL64_15645 [Blastocatellia bacterium]|nr:hypothetical protein [Blastocatellia bacterium]
MFKEIVCLIATFFLLVSTGFSGIRGPGKYSGIVVFDRWDTCYLYSSAYVMYISEKKKESLRQYAGKSIQIDATEVFQPINPGDGLIKEFKYLGEAEATERTPDVDGLRIVLGQDVYGKNFVRFTIEIENQSQNPTEFDVSDIAPTVFGLKDEEDPFRPSDGKSEARITRCNFGSGCGFPNLTFGPEGQLTADSYSIRLQRYTPIRWEKSRLAPKAKLQLRFTARVAKGEYEMVVGYGGGVHSGKGIVSNKLLFRTDITGTVRQDRDILGDVRNGGRDGNSFLGLLFNNHDNSYFREERF